MRLLVTSFGMTRHFPKSGRPRDVISFPEYEVLLLVDKLVLNGATIDQFEQSPDPTDAAVGEFLRVMSGEGFVESADFDGIVKKNRPLLEKMLAHDMGTLDQWAKPFAESCSLTMSTASTRMLQYLDRADTTRRPQEEGRRRGLRHMGTLFRYSDDCVGDYPRGGTLDSLDAARSTTKRRQARYRGAFRKELEPRLRFVNTHLILANELDAGFHNDIEFLPFYRHKFLSVGGQGTANQSTTNKVRQLFDVAFPEFRITNNKTFLRILRDKRLAELRTLIRDAARGDVELDRDFARDVYREVFGVEKRLQKWRRVVSYATLPVGLIPWIGTPAQKVLEEAFGGLFEKILRRQHCWFFLLSGASVQGRTGSGEGD